MNRARYTLFLFFLLAGLFLHNNVFANCPNVTPTFTASPASVCGPGFTPVSFVNTSTGVNAGTATYKWYKNGALFDNTTGLVAPINSSVNAVGTYTFMLISNDGGCKDTAIVTVIVHPVPNAAFTFAPNNACAGTNVVFTNNSTGTDASTTYLWNFGDATTSTATNPSHTYAAGGTYTVTLTQTNGAGCTSSATATVTVLAIPNANITGDDGDGNTTNCLLPGDPTTSETVTFTNSTTGAVSYLWNFGDGTTSTAFSPSHTYSSFGTYTVTMTATGANGCTSTATIIVVFEKYVAASLTLSILEYSGCVPHTLTTLTNLSVNANTYVWNFGDGTPPVTTTTLTPPIHTYVTGGTYTITLTASNSCNSATATISPIVIVAGPIANFSSSTSLGCAPQTVTFANTSTGASPANNYQWDMGNGNTYTNVTTPPAQTYSTQGSYTVTLIAGSACGRDTIQQTIIIDSIPVADITSNPLVGCSPLTVSTINNSYGNNVTYSWFVDGVFTTNAINLPNQVFTAPAGNTAVTHTISLTVSNHCGTDSDMETITVHPAVVAQFNMSTDTICAGGSITFTDASFGDMLTWNWNFGNGTTSTLQGPHTVTYNLPGTYAVQLSVNGFCGPSTATQNIVVLPYPVADFITSVSSGCIPQTVSFTNNSTLGVSSYAWSFGAGATPANSTVYAPAPVTYSTAGTSMIVLTVNNLGCISRDTNYITLNPLPLPSFTVTPAMGCSPLNVVFNNTSPVTAGDTYNWNLGNGSTSTLFNPLAQTYVTITNSDSIYAVTLTITTSNGCSASANTNITVHPLPVADFTPLPDTVCAGTAIAFLNNSTGASSYLWDFGDGSATVTTISPAHIFSSQGNYVTTLIATSSFGCKDSLQSTIVVDSIPTSNFNFTVECMGDTTRFTDLSTGSVTNWAWNFGDGTTSTLQNPNHLYAVNGTYNVILVVTNPAGCTNTFSQLVNVNLVPVASFLTSSTCLSSPSSFIDNSTGSPVAWNWDFGDGVTSILQNPTHTYGAVGTYSVTLIAFGGSGCSDTVIGTITVTPIPTADFTFASVCTNDTTFFLSISGGAPDTFIWNFGDGISDATNNPSPSHVYNTAANYLVTLTAGYASSGCTNTINYTVAAYPRTVPNFSSNTPCLGAATNFTDLTTNTPIQWNWDFGDGNSSTLQNPTNNYLAPGFYTVSLITENAFTCVDTFTNTIQVFPLPTAGFTFDTICETFSTSFTDLSTSSVAWNWNFGDGSPADLNTNPNHIFPSAGTYSVLQIVTNNVGCTDSSTQTVTVNPNPVANFSSTIACHTYANSFTDLSTGAITWQWNFGDGSPLDLNQNTTHIYPLDGTYPVELIITNIFGCSDSITQNATVLLQPQSAFTNSTVCAGQTVSFTDATTGTPTSWLWDFGDGTATSSLQNPTHIYATGGTYTITLITGNIAGCMDTLLSPINVFTVPIPNFTSDTVCLFSITHFTDLSTDAVALSNWYWDYSDGNSSFSQNPNYIFMAPGTYNVSLTVTNVNGCDSSVVLPVIINAIPVANFTADTACVGAPTNFSDLSTGSPTQWTWNFGDGTTSNVGPNVAHTYPAAGTYVVTLIVGDASGICTDMTTQIVTISNAVTANFTMPDTVCVGDVVPFTDLSTSTGTPITTWFWDFGNGHVSPLQNSTTIYDVSGTYVVSLTVAAGSGCSSTATQTILVAPKPTVSFTLSNACVGQTATFNSTSTSGGMPLSSSTWYFGDGTTGTGTNVTHTYAVEGTYTVSLVINSIAGCNDSISMPVIIHPLPLAAFTNPTVCLGDTVQFTDLSTITSGSILFWDWNFGDGATANIQNPIHEFNVLNDTFSVTLIVISDFGCRDTVTQNAYTLPVVSFNFGPDVINGCAPLLVNFTDNSTISGGNIVGWVWNFDDGNFSFGQNPTHGYPIAGSYYVSLTVTTSAGCTFTDTLNYAITIYPQPIAGFSETPPTASIYQPNIQFVDLSSGAMYYEWDFGDLNYSNVSAPSHFYNTPSTYVVTQIVTNGYGCSDTAAHDILILEESTLFVPNAVTPDGDGFNDFFLPMGSGITNYHFYIFDRWGELIFESTDMTQSWDCMYKGYKVKEDVYVWKADIIDLNNQKKTLYGHVTVLR